MNGGKGAEKKFRIWGDGDLKNIFSQGRKEKNGGITFYVNERGWLIRVQEYNQQSTMFTSLHYGS